MSVGLTWGWHKEAAEWNTGNSCSKQPVRWSTAMSPFLISHCRGDTGNSVSSTAPQHSVAKQTQAEDREAYGSQVPSLLLGGEILSEYQDNGAELLEQPGVHRLIIKDPQSPEIRLSVTTYPGTLVYSALFSCKWSFKEEMIWCLQSWETNPRGSGKVP